MKEIKYKAFWYEDKVTTSIDTLEFLHGGLRVSDGCCHQGWNSKDCEIKEYTGLKDKNGTEIYKGDIVIACWYSHEEPEGETTGEVIFNEGWLSYCIWNEQDKTMSEMNGQCHYTWEIEVIGNKYDNPELLVS